MEQPTKEEVKRWLSVAQSGLIGREYRDVFLKLPQILRAYLALREEVKEIDLLYKGLERMSATDKRTIQQLQAENQALRARLAKSVIYEATKKGETLEWDGYDV